MPKEVSIVIRVKNKAQQGIDSAKRGFSGLIQKAKALKGMLIGTGLAFGALAGFIKKSVDAFAIQQKAEIDLESALKKTGNTSKGVSKELKALAANIQSVTDLGDEAIISQQAVAINMGVSSDRMEEATIAAVGLAKAYKIDLKTSFMLIARAASGSTEMLTRYGIILKEGGTDQEKFNELLGKGAGLFEVAAEQGKSLEAQLQRNKNAYGDFTEEMGKAFSKGADLGEQQDSMQKFWERMAKDRTAQLFFESIGAAVAGVASVIGPVMKFLVTGFTAVQGTIESLFTGIAVKLAGGTFKEAADAMKSPFERVGDDVRAMWQDAELKNDVVSKAKALGEAAGEAMSEGAENTFQFDADGETAHQKRMSKLPKGKAGSFYDQPHVKKTLAKHDAMKAATGGSLSVGDLFGRSSFLTGGDMPASLMTEEQKDQELIRLFKEVAENTRGLREVSK